jgi:hypothetical protein
VGIGIRFQEIDASNLIPDAHPYTVVISIHPTLWSQLHRYIEASPDGFCILDKIQPEADNLVANVGCSNEAARRRFDAAWV